MILVLLTNFFYIHLMYHILIQKHLFRSYFHYHILINHEEKLVRHHAGIPGQIAIFDIEELKYFHLL